MAVKVQVLMFGSLRERYGFAKKEMQVDNLAGLKNWLESEQPHMAQLNYLLAVNQELVQEDITLTEGDEIAIMPPFAGG